MNYSHLINYYHGRKVFITGHTGFKGSWMLYFLNLLGARVKGYSLAPQNETDHFNIINGSNLCESIIADIRDSKTLTKEILDFQPDFIFHLAAQPLVRLSYLNPSDTFSINALGTAYLFDALRLLPNVCQVVVITTDKVYENLEWIYPYREVDRLGGYDPYSASKACTELIIDSYRKSYFDRQNFLTHKKSIASARAGNVIGGGDWSNDRIIPDLVKSIISKESIILRNPQSIRPWQHVLESIGAYLHLGTKLVDDPIKYAESWNFGPFNNENITVKELVQIATEVWGDGKFVISPSKDQFHEAKFLALDISKAINVLGWMPKLSPHEAINMTIDWYKSYRVNNKLITEYQIKEFLL